MKQRFLTIALLLLTSMYSFAHDFEVDGIYYNVLSEEERTVEVTYKGDEYFWGSDNYIGKVTIPLSISFHGKSYDVVRIGDNSFYNCKNLLSVVIPNSMLSIGESAFAACSSLIDLDVPNSVTSIDRSAFSGCSSLLDITLSSSIKSIPMNALSGCKSLTSINIPSSVTSIERWAFYI